MSLNEEINKISEQDFKYLIEHGKRLDIDKQKFLGQKVVSLIFFPYGLVKSKIPSNLASGDIEQIILDCLFYKKTFYNKIKLFIFKGLGLHKRIKVQKAMPFILWIYDELKVISQIEEHLSSPPKAEMLAAGIDSLNELGVYVTIDMLVKDWGVYTHDQVEEMEYHKIFDKLMLMKKQADIQEKLAEMQKKKNYQNKF